MALFAPFNPTYHAGFLSLPLEDTTRVYKPNTTVTDSLHYRPVDLDIWYPSRERSDTPLTFGYLFRLLKKRTLSYQEHTDYTGMTEEPALLYVAELGLGAIRVI